ncbi:EVE domain-containing protein [Candidatus Kaiserbacteria bacterium RIFCSPHIGHO2_01_FULL_54_36]|uniref:EVE domain-containing protein n=1 Tax=Candidatus Kaiserbacteria bacterium RIFCSPHIGHO2_01_FULL_54_36 TaxID=1798482 RepID=A0A1F6CLZ1_9BACT|nr:MAG: EVE domain-containing protein [Candidatus Kaiserbacteria bacterium RIFCSPHIGHO2_01_FULL_54_36]OGG75931.1 MAG: EVE domain-containing protein [Candidatus Kaiserbacteria bacterium RIFCSPLOWO2_01_FULL_54_22]
MQYWLLKSEPETFGIVHLEKAKKEPWTGVRNFVARNYMRDKMRVGDLCLFCHTGKLKGIAGIAKVASRAYPDPSQFDKKSDYYEPRASYDKPYWWLVDIAFVKKFKKPVLVGELKSDPALSNMILFRAPRLSIQPVSEKDFQHIMKLAA